jgi:polar amino acid transport system substrate-binding protein
MQPTPRSRWSQRAGWVALWVLAGCAIALAWLLQRPDDSLERKRRAGVLRVGYAVEPPYALVGPGGVVTGESPEVARHLAARLGIPRIEWFQVGFADLIPQLRERRFDVVAAGLFVTPARAQLVRYSEPTLRVRPGWLTATGNPRQLGSYADTARRADVRVAVLRGSVEQAQMQRLGHPALLETPDAQTALAAVVHDRAEALALSLPTVRSMAAARPDRLAAIPAADAASRAPGAAPGADYVAFAFHPHDASLQQAWNRALAAYVGSDEHLAVLARFGFTRDDLPGPVRTAEIMAR